MELSNFLNFKGKLEYKIKSVLLIVSGNLQVLKHVLIWRSILLRSLS